jgi:predicted RNA-binding Zn ribbon-like protein
MDWTPNDFVGRHPALDFLNTVSGPDKARHRNRIASLADLRSWWAHLPDRPVDHLPEAHEAGIAAIVALRETAFAVLGPLATGQDPAAADFARLADGLKRMADIAPLSCAGGHLHYRLQPQRMIDPFVWMLDDLVRHADLARLQQCGRCSWLFLGTGRGQPRRWCTMATCGNRAKVAQYRERHA